MSDYDGVLDRVLETASLLSSGERDHAEQVVGAGRRLASRPRNDGKLVAHPDDAILRRDLARLTELLGRRGSHGLPAAALGRAALADLAGDSRSRTESLLDCDAKLKHLGL